MELASSFHDVKFADFAVADARLNRKRMRFQVGAVAVRQPLLFQLGHGFRAQMLDLLGLCRSLFAVGQQRRQHWQRRRRRDFYLRNGFRETGVGRTYGPVAMTILLRGDDTFTQADYSQITAELFRLWRPPGVTT